MGSMEFSQTLHGKLDKIRELVEKSADRRCWSDEPEFNPDDFSGGNFDDAYAGGVEDGKAEMARSIIEIINS